MDNCDLDPDFAVICSFINLFGDKIDLQKLNIERLKSSLENQCELDNDLIELHIKLLKKVRRYFVRDQWEKALIRFASEYSYEDSYEIESLGYLKAKPSTKVCLLRNLLEYQFDCDLKFKAAINSCQANELRVQPIGRDIHGSSYWHSIDEEGNFSVFLEKPLDYRYFKAICTKPEELNYLIEELDKTKEEKVKGEPIHEPYNPLPEIFPEYFIKEEGEQNEFKEEEKEDNNNDTHEKKPAKTKKGSQVGLKKSSPLPVLQEADEESNIIYNSSKYDTVIEQNGKENIISDNISKDNLSTTKDQNSIESQVKTTIENLINRVALSLGNLIRPKTGSWIESIYQDKPQEEQPKKQRKRQTKKEKLEENLPRRSSSRLQQKKIAEQQQEELKKIIESSEKKKSYSEPSQDDDSRSQKSHRKRIPDDEFSKTKKRRKRGRSWRGDKGKKLAWDKDDSDLSNTSSTGSEDESDDIEDTFKYDNSNLDDEFACEEEETNLEPVIIKRARTARQSMGDDKQDLSDTVLEEDKPCERCLKSNDPEWILLCDICDGGYHTSCCLPPLMVVPDGDWFCPPCEHKLLLTKMKEFYSSITELLETKERERVKKQRFRQNHVKKEPIAEITQETARESSNTERQDDVSHRKPRKTYSRRIIQESDQSEMDEAETPSEQSYSSEEVKPKARRARASVSYRFQEYDELIKSAIKGDSYDEESSEEEESVSNNSNYGRGKDMATIEALAYQQENGLMNRDIAIPAEGTNIELPKQKPRKKSRRLNDLDAGSDTEDASDESFQASSATEAEDEEDDLTDVETEFDSDASIDELVSSKYPKSKKKRARRSSYDSEDSEYQPTRTRRAASKRVSYLESSDEEDSSYATAPRKATNLSSDEESQASWKSSGQDSPIDDEQDSVATQVDSLDELVTPISTQEDIPQVSESADVQATTNIQPIEEQDTDTAPQKGFKKVRLERKEQVIKVQSYIKPMLNDSIDEIAAPLYQQPIYHAIPLQPPLAYTSLDHGQPNQINQTNVSPGQLCHRAEESPIQDLMKYCRDTLSTKNFVGSTAHPPFYGDEDLRPSSSSDNRKRA